MSALSPTQIPMFYLASFVAGGILDRSQLPALPIQSSLLSLDRRDNLATVPTRPELQVPNALPCSCCQATVRDRDIDRCANKGRFDVSLLGN
jgi:hypothetical protein